MIDLPHVFKLGKGPEYVHVNLLTFLFKNPGRKIFGLSSDTPMCLRSHEKMSELSMFNYPDLLLSVHGCIVRYINKQKRKITHGT